MSKRRIIVGFLEPTTLEGDTIYVCVRRDRNKSSDEAERTVQAMALSLESFQYGEDKRDITVESLDENGHRMKQPVYKAWTHDLQAKRLVEGDYRPFVELLSQKNDGMVSDRFIDDGINMYERLEGIGRLAV